MSLRESAVAYLRARFNKLSEKDKLVSILMDEVYNPNSVQYVNEKFYGEEKGDQKSTLVSCSNL